MMKNQQEAEKVHKESRMLDLAYRPKESTAEVRIMIQQSLAVS